MINTTHSHATPEGGYYKGHFLMCPSCTPAELAFNLIVRLQVMVRMDNTMPEAQKRRGNMKLEAASQWLEDSAPRNVNPTGRAPFGWHI